ncbi:MAG TPA: hypothetical protein P5052_01655 [Candidatus Paceibacterota bacterium]|nr:hypothetical protein [Candidatus Paceibacterota bacterium]HRZ29468.1 hypothetical protein [Candidatus Paceibacterota bacterium]
MRNSRLISEGSPCDTDFLDETMQTTEDAKKKGRQVCPNHEECIKRSQEEGIRCGRLLAKQMANFILNNKKPYVEAIAEEKNDFLADENIPNGKFWVCDEENKWIVVEGKINAVNYVLQFAQTIIDLKSGERRPFTQDGMKMPEMGPGDAIHNAVLDLNNLYREVGAKPI